MLRVLPAIVFGVMLSGVCMSQGFSDEFNGSIDSRWEWLRPDATRQLMLGSQLTIITQNGALYGTNFNNVRNLLMQNAPAGSYAIETKVSFDADSTFHNAGVLYYRDDDNFVSVAKGWYLGQRVAMMTWEEDATYKIKTVPVESQGPLYLRLTARENIHFSGEYSTDGTSWNAIADTWTGFPSSPARIGLKAANGEGVNVTQRQIPARFDYFRVNTTVSVPRIPAAPADGFVLSVYPAPVHRGGQATLRLTSPAQRQLRILVYDTNGRVVTDMAAVAYIGNTTVALPVMDIPSGVYVIAVMDGQRISTSLMHVL